MLTLPPIRARFKAAVRSKLDAYFPRAALSRHLTETASKRRPLRVWVARTSLDGPPHDVLLRKQRRGIEICCNHTRILKKPMLTRQLGLRASVIAVFFAETEESIRSCRAEFSDGHGGKAGVISFCSPNPASILIPDPEFYSSGAYAGLRRRALSAPPWRERDDIVVWRGSTTGGGGMIFDQDMNPANPRLIPRVRMCLLLRNVAGTDARVVNAAQAKDPAAATEALAAAGIIADRIEQNEWLGKKFALDIDGNSNAWSNLFSRLLCGCCVIKIASPRGYRQWYYEDLVPWRHYVPASADLSDLVERIEWCRSHPAECEAIAAAGKALVDGMTLEAEMSKTTRLLNEVLPRG